MAETVVLATRVAAPYAASIRRIAELRRTTVSDVLARLVVEQVAPLDNSPDELGGAAA